MSEPGASRAGFVLVGGHSSRMGSDKALVEFQGSTLAARIAECVRSAAGSVTLVGPPERYRELGYTVIADRVPNRGPLGGIYTALLASRAEWNLILACDMPFVTTALLEELFAVAESGPSTADCVVPESLQPEGRIESMQQAGLDAAHVGLEAAPKAKLDPLCAVYHRRCAHAARHALDRNILKMHDFISTLRLIKYPVADPASLANINSPADWSRP